MRRSDAELIEAACGGDVDSFRQLYERYYALAVGIAHGQLADGHLAEDAAQEAFATACRRLYALRDGERFAPWLGTICRRTAAKMARRHTTNGAPLVREPIAPVRDDNSRSTELHAALGQLSSSEREIIHLHYFSGLTHNDIARVLGISPQAVHGRMQRARRKLATHISNPTRED